MDFNPEMLQNLINCDLGVSTYSSPVDELSSVRRHILRDTLFKKWIPSDTNMLANIAIDGFKTSNSKCSEFSLPHPLSRDMAILRTARSLIYSYFFSGVDQSSVFTLEDILSRGKAGPGASCSTRHTDFYQKMFGGPLSSTSIFLYHHYKNNISSTWLDAELTRSRLFGVEIVQGSNLSTVPKNAKTNRTICTEPSLNMFYQLGAGSIIEDLLVKFHNIRIKSDGVNLQQADVNRELARLGSVNGSLATIDLRSASDTISKKLVDFLFPPSVVSVLDLIRSPSTRVDGEYINLDMISSMGNGFTFPLQTLIFATLVEATYLHTGIFPKCKKDRNYSVFGDDIICLSKRYIDVVSVLESSGFIVNSDKSYYIGPFRESCGKDYWNGHLVRGVYLTEVRTAADLYSAFNRLMDFSIRYSIDLTSALQYLKGLAVFRPVPLHAGFSEGFRIPRCFLLSPKVTRHGSVYYHALVSRDNKKKITGRERSFNFQGAVIGAIGGYVRNNSVDVRVNTPALKVVRRLSPSWDLIPDAELTTRAYELNWRCLL